MTYQERLTKLREREQRDKLVVRLRKQKLTFRKIGAMVGISHELARLICEERKATR